ncbi:MAG: gliding motility protein GldN [Bacteroidia bacterium]|nr:gliding motility protein GldN [Bacteroidia bacterium]
MEKRNFLLLLAFFIVGNCLAQETDGQYNPNSLLNIPKYEQLYKAKVWRTIDLREKQNKGFFSKGNEISGLIIKAVKSGEIADVYMRDSLTAKMEKAAFQQNLVSQAGQTFPSWDPASDFYSGDPVTHNGKNYMALADSKGQNPETSPNEWQSTTAGTATEFLFNEIYQMTLVEDVIFDKRRSRLYYDMLAIRLEAFDQNTQTYKLIGWFKYKDLEKLFRNHPDEAIWFNRYNTAENKNYADAFLLRLFHGTIDKVENPDDNRIFDIYSTSHKEGVWATEWEEMKMMEREHNLWEY